jgi:D-alanyl-D-alanine dipeptidase
MILLVLLLQLADSLPPKPAPAPAAWRNLIGAYLRGSDTVYVYEDGGALFAHADSQRVALTGPKDSVFRVWKHLQLGPANGGQLRLQPVQPVAELLRVDRTLTPPAESGAFLAPDLVEPVTLDSSIHLDVRYATTNNFLSSVFYASPRAFLQRPAAMALVRASRVLRPLGYGLLIHDAYRPWYVTKVFWDATPPASHWLVADPASGSKHNRGAAVDITLYDLKTRAPVAMPSTYDEATPRAYADFPGGTSLQRWHRALLRQTLEREGFTANPSEWWHFDFHGWQQYPILNIAFEALETTRYTHADTLRGSNGPARAWWDAQFYDLHVAVNPRDSSITGWNRLTYRVVQSGREMQIDLQSPLTVDSIVQAGRKLKFRRDGNAFFVALTAAQRAGSSANVTVWYHGKPRIGARLPWDGGFTFQRDSLGRPWIATANEGLGASVWWPLKDYLADEPDSQRIAITLPDSIVDVSNGRLRSTNRNRDGTTTYEWFVTSPINNYNVTINAARYAHFSDTLNGEAGKLSLDFWPLDYHVDTARGQFKQVTTDAAMLRALVRSVSVVRRRLQADRDAAPRHGASERDRLRQSLPQRLSGRDCRAPGSDCSGISSSCTRARTSGGATTSRPRTRRHVGARELRELRRGDLHGVPARQECRRGVHDRRAARGAERSADHPGVRRERARLGRHVSQGREHAAHDPRDHR